MNRAIPLAVRAERLTWTLLVLAVAVSFGVTLLSERWMAALGIVGALLVFIAPVEVALGLYAFSIPFDNVLAPGIGATISWTAGVFAGTVLLALGITGRRFQAPTRPAFWWGLFTFWTLASVFWAMDSGASMKWVATVASLFALYLVGVSVRVTSRELWRLVSVVVAGGVLATAVLVFQSRTTGLQDRATFVFADQASNPNEVGYSLLIPFALALGAFVSAGTRFHRMLVLAGTTAIAFGIFLTMSRGALFALVGTLIAFLLRVGTRRRLFVAIAAVVVSLALLPNLFFERLKEIPTGRGTGRVDIFMVGAQIVKHNPVLGVGLANFGVAYDEYAGYAPVFRGYGRAAHNAFLQVWAETGIIGLLLFLAAIYSQMNRARRAAVNCDLPKGLIVSAEAIGWGLLIACLSGHIAWAKSFWLGWLLMAVIARQSEAEVANAAPIRP